MNRCTQLDESLQEHVPNSTTARYPDNFKGQGHMGFLCFSVCMKLRLPVHSLEQGLMILFPFKTFSVLFSLRARLNGQLACQCKSWIISYRTS